MVVQAAAPAAGRVALVAGATGLVGREVLAALLTDKHYAAVHCLGRRPLTLQHPKLFSHVVDFLGHVFLGILGLFVQVAVDVVILRLLEFSIREFFLGGFVNAIPEEEP